MQKICPALVIVWCIYSPTNALAADSLLNHNNHCSAFKPWGSPCEQAKNSSLDGDISYEPVSEQDVTTQTHEENVDILASKKKTFECQTCFKSLANKSNLVIHMRTHTKELPYQCLECGRRFCDPANFKKHKNTHLGIKKYFCPAKGCHAGFLLRTDLKRHKKSHSKDKPIKCPMAGCLSKFKRKDNLRRHIREVHGKNNLNHADW